MQTAFLDPQLAGGPEDDTRRLLVEALEQEVGLLDGLRSVFVAQREAISLGDPRALDDGVFAATRIMRTMDEARRRRRHLTSTLLGSDLDFDELDAVLADARNRPVRNALIQVREAAGRLRSEVRMLRQILQVSLSDNRRHLEVLLGDSSTTALGPSAGSDTGAVLDRVG